MKHLQCKQDPFTLQMFIYSAYGIQNLDGSVCIYKDYCCILQFDDNDQAVVIVYEYSSYYPMYL